MTLSHDVWSLGFPREATFGCLLGPPLYHTRGFGQNLTLRDYMAWDSLILIWVQDRHRWISYRKILSDVKTTPGPRSVWN